MKIKGLQKFTLIDYPGKFACTIFLFGCNLRCGFCHNPELVVREGEQIFSQKDILEFLEKRKEKLEGVCITGGEPLISLDKNFVKSIKNLGYLVKIDTNGCFPGKLKEFIDENLVDFIAMDIKTCKEKYDEVVGVNVDIEKVEESIGLIGKFKDYEFRTTIVEGIHTKENLIKMSRWVNKVVGRKPVKMVLQGFKNSGKFIDEKYQTKQNTSEKFLIELKNAIKDYFEEVYIRD